MSDTFTQLNIHLVYAVKFRAALIARNWQGELHKYITGIVQKRGHKMLQVNSEPDHIHIFFGLNPKEATSTLVQFIKSDSSEWINRSGFCQSKFRWQGGFGAFSHSQSAVPEVIRYIQNQRSHHQHMTFLEEYRQFLNNFEIEFDEKYLFMEPV